jgi:hypothetical protein
MARSLSRPMPRAAMTVVHQCQWNSWAVLRRDCPEGRILTRAGAARLPAKEAFPAIDRASLGRLEGDCGFAAALRARCHGLRLGEPAATAPGRALALQFTVFTALGLVFEVFVMEEVLFSRCKYEICSAINTLEDAVLEVRHTLFPVFNLSFCRIVDRRGRRAPPPVPYSISRRDFFRFRLRASACLARSFSPGFK